MTLDKSDHVLGNFANHFGFDANPKHTNYVFVITLFLVIISLVVTADSIRRHLVAGGAPGEFVFTVRILLMVPVYSVQSWAALYWRLGPQVNGLLEFIRKSYECIVIFAFLQLLEFQLDGFRKIARTLDRMEPARLYHPGIIGRLIPGGRDCWLPGTRFVRRTCSCVMVYVPATFIPACFVLVSSLFIPGLVRFCKPLALLIINGGQIMAMYGLIFFGYTNLDGLKGIHPVWKFLSIKCLLIVTNLQAFVIHLIYHFQGFWVANDNWTPGQSAEAFLNVLLIVEMFLVAIAHRWIYLPGELCNRSADSGTALLQEEADGDSHRQSLLWGSSSSHERQRKQLAPDTTMLQKLLICFRFMDIIDFYEALKHDAPTKSTDDLSDNGSVRMFCRYACCHFFGCVRSDSEDFVTGTSQPSNSSLG